MTHALREGRGGPAAASGSSEGDVLGWIQKMVATRGRSRSITCCGVTVGDWSCTSFSGESGQPRASSPPGRRRLLFPPLLPGTSLESLPVAGSRRPPTSRAFGNRFSSPRVSQGRVSSPHLPEACQPPSLRSRERCPYHALQSHHPGSAITTHPPASSLALPGAPAHPAASPSSSGCYLRAIATDVPGDRAQNPTQGTRLPRGTALSWRGWANNSHAGILPVYLGSGEQHRA